MADDLKGQEEVGRETGLYGGHTLSWEEVNAKRRANVESDPQVIIIGAGQTGLQIAARFGQMKIRTIVVEANPRVGDNWRKRYPTLVLHTPRTYVNMLYQSFPKNWPTFTPRDKLANWLEQYAESQDIVVWNKSCILPVPRYDDKALRWDIIVNRNGTLVELHPAHIVVAAGTLGAPCTPEVDGSHEFLGEVFHASRFMGAQPFAGKRVIVVGAGSTAADICQELSFRGAATITMVARKSTCVVSAKVLNAMLDAAFPEGVPTEICDFKRAAMPFPVIRAALIEQQEERLAHDKDLHDGLRKAGLKLNDGADGSGQLSLVFEKLGGYWIDVGCGELVVSGKIQIKSDVELRRFTSNTVIFSDESELAADVVIFATGYENIRNTMRETFSAKVIDHTEEVWGLDDEGESRGCYRPSGQPGLWFGAGDFWNSRFFSKLLAIQIKARELGLVSA